jgi:small subunit ribosomal protein S6
LNLKQPDSYAILVIRESFYKTLSPWQGEAIDRKEERHSMKEYELALVVSAKITDEERTAVVAKAKDYITRHGGEVGETEEWGKRKLAYPIQKMEEGYYYFIQFTAGPETPNELEQRMRIMDNVLRYLIVRADGEDEFHQAPAQEAPVEEAPAAEEAPAEEPAAEAPTEE